MRVHCAYDEMKDVDLLTPHPRNANKHPEKQIKYLAKIMAHQGWRHPITVSKRSGFIVAGHGRLEAARLNGWSEAPIDYQDFDSEADEYAHLIADNKIAELAEHDDAMMIDTIKNDFPDIDLELLGLPDLVIEEMEPEPEGDPDAIPEDVDTRAKPGDVWQLGKHRLMCGDSTNIQHVEKLMNGEAVGMTFTSPPYNAAKESHLNGRVGGFDNKYQKHADNLTDDEYANLLKDFTSLAVEKSKYVFVNLQLLAHNRIPLIEYQHHFKDLLKDILIWNKSQCPPNIVKGAFNTKWEYVFCFSIDRKTRGFPVKWQGKFPNVVETESNSGNEFAKVHKAGFPVTFPLWFLEKLDLGSVYDPFGGTGTTLIACEKANRRCVMMELDPHYCDVILSRWEKYTGKEAVRLEEGSDAQE